MSTNSMPPERHESGVPLQRVRLSREEFAKISEIEGIRLTDEMNAVFADFDARKLSPEERRREIIRRFKAPAAE